MTQYEKKKYKNRISKISDVELVKDYEWLSDRCMGSLSERMFALDYPPDMVREQYEQEKEDNWCLHALEEELSKRHLTDSIFAFIEDDKVHIADIKCGEVNENVVKMQIER